MVLARHESRLAAAVATEPTVITGEPAPFGCSAGTPSSSFSSRLASISRLAAALISVRFLAASRSRSASASLPLQYSRSCIAGNVRTGSREPKAFAVQPSILEWGIFCPVAGYSDMRQDRNIPPQVGGSVVVWLVIAVVAGIGLLGLVDPGSIELLVTAEM
jgi:hypothetical protein